MLLEQTADRPRFAPDLKRIEMAGRRLVELIREELSPEPLAGGTVDARRLQAEFRTPLNHVIGYSELLIEQAEQEGAEDLVPDLEKISRAAQALLRLVEERLTAEVLVAAAATALPAVAPTARPDALALTRSAASVPPAGPGGEGGLILVVDDDPGNRDMLSRRLRQQGFRVEVAEDGERALGCLRSASCDLVLLDLVMPGMAGDEVLTRIKADRELRHVPVILLSALDEMDSVVRCILMGAEDYLAKPFNAVLLRARIGACLEKSRLRRQEAAYLEALETERRKSESLLLNVLPAPIADRLKRGETTIVDSLPEVTVMFADLVGFTALASRVASVDVVRLLDEVFSAFDELAAAQGLEKIKTIGDAYMVVGGLPTPRADHAEAVAEAALGMMAYVEQHPGDYPVPLRLRIGINTGPVIAGVIGRHKFNYDLWGDTVNTASRMESHGLPGRIQVGAAVYERLRGRYTFEARGTIEMKGMGIVPAWFLTGRGGAAPCPPQGSDRL